MPDKYRFGLQTKHHALRRASGPIGIGLCKNLLVDVDADRTIKDRGTRCGCQTAAARRHVAGFPASQSSIRPFKFAISSPRVPGILR